MNKKFSLGITISLMAIACAITFVITWSVSLSIYNSKIAGVNEREEIYTKMQEVDSYVRNNFIGNIDEDALIEAIMNGYIDGIDDPYAEYMTADEYYEYTQREKGIAMGVGLNVVIEGTGYILINSISAGSPAAETDIAAGDIITKVGTQNILEIGAAKAVELFSVNEGETVTFTVQHDGEEKEYTLTAKSIATVSVTFDVANEIGYVYISSFNSTTPEQFTEAINTLTERGVKGIIFDIRNNGGGSVSATEQMLNELIGEATVSNAVYKDGTVKPLVKTDSEKSVNLPMIVLVNENSASASEIFAQALRDFKNAQLVGTITYGKAVMQVTQSFTDGTAVKVTVADIVPATSASYKDTGIKPDYIVEMTGIIDTDVSLLKQTSDFQLIKAFEVMETLVQNSTTNNN